MKLNIVPARTGILWVKLGILTFLKQPLALGALFFMYTMLLGLFLVVPIVGPFLMMAAVPMGTLALMAASQQAAEGRFPTPSVVLSAFRAGRARLRSMLILGAMYAAACVAIMLVVSLLVPLPGSAKTPAELVELPEFRQSMVWTALLYLPVSLLFWHAPALVHWHGVPPIKSLFFSVVACWRNAGAFVVYGLGWLGAAILIVAATALVSALSAVFAQLILTPIVLMTAVAFYSSIYFTFRDSFVTTLPGDNP